MWLDAHSAIPTLGWYARYERSRVSNSSAQYNAGVSHGREYTHLPLSSTAHSVRQVLTHSNRVRAVTLAGTVRALPHPVPSRPFFSGERDITRRCPIPPRALVAAAGRQLAPCPHGAQVMRNAAHAPPARTRYMSALSSLASGSTVADRRCRSIASPEPAACARRELDTTRC